MKTLTWKHTIGDRIKNYKEDGSLKRDLTIIDRKIEQKEYPSPRTASGKIFKTRKYYKYHCNVCDWSEGWIVEDSLCGKEKTGCSCCAHMTIVKGINDIATTHPHLVQYFYNKQDAYSHTAHSDFKPELICPVCGQRQNKTNLAALTKHGFSCSACSDGISYGEKFINSLLRQLQINFIPQLSKNEFDWCERYRYDFYFEWNNEKYIMEVHGIQHYQDRTLFHSNLKQIQQTDKKKKLLAENNGFNNGHYIELDCRKSDPQWIQQSILSSRLSEIFDLTTINWMACHEKAAKSWVKDVAQYWEQHKPTCTTHDIAHVFGLHPTTIIKYLKIGTQLNLCQYSAQEELNKNLHKARAAHEQAVVFLNKQFEVVATFSSQTEAAALSTQILKERTPMNKQSISRAVRNAKTHRYRNYYVLSLQDYINLKGDFNNENYSVN